MAAMASNSGHPARGHGYRPQSSSASRFTAGAVGFFTFTQQSARPSDKATRAAWTQCLRSRAGRRAGIRSRIPLVMLIEHDAGMWGANELRQLPLALLRSACAADPRPLARSGRRRRERRRTPWRDRRMSSNIARPVSSVTIASPSIRNERPGRAVTAAAASGNRAVKS